MRRLFPKSRRVLAGIYRNEAINNNLREERRSCPMSATHNFITNRQTKWGQIALHRLTCFYGMSRQGWLAMRRHDGGSGSVTGKSSISNA